MEEILEILQQLHPDVDFESHEALIDEGILDSMDIISITAELNDSFDIHISPIELIPENFNSAKALFAMVTRLSEEG